jgi:hypothetical protein
MHKSRPVFLTNIQKWSRTDDRKVIKLGEGSHFMAESILKRLENKIGKVRKENKDMLFGHIVIKNKHSECENANKQLSGATTVLPDLRQRILCQMECPNKGG